MLKITYVTQNEQGVLERFSDLSIDTLYLPTEPTLPPQFFRVECLTCGKVHENIQELLKCNAEHGIKTTP